MGRFEQHMTLLDGRILDKQVLGLTYKQRTSDNLELAISKRLIQPGDRALEVGTGDGLMLALLRERGVTASGVCKSRSDYELLKQKGYDIHFCDMSDLPFADHSFDFIYTRNAFDHSLMPAITLCEFRRVLKPHKNMFIEFEWYNVEDLEKQREVPRLAPVYKDGGSYSKHRHWSAMTYDQMRWLLRRLDLKLVDSFFAHESQAFIVENAPCRNGAAEPLDQWGRFTIGLDGPNKKPRRSLIGRLFGHKA